MKKHNTNTQTVEFTVGDILICLDGTDSHGILKKGLKYKVVDTDGIRVQLEDKPLTWANIRFKKSKY